MSQAKEVHIIFANEVQPLNENFNGGNRFQDVTFHDVYRAERGIAGLIVQFEVEGAEYFYPWHTIARTKITRY